ncbi:MAG TPA: serine--tRNA ligase, partial [Microbacteriaceae bacterium]|nr:serine--tRNA ligase [Microbacteriaceae bacterium]
MIDPVLLRSEPERVRASQAARGDDVRLVDDAIAADASRRAALTEFETLRAEQNAHSKVVAKAAKEEKAALVAQAQDLAARVKAAQQASSDAETAFDGVVSRIGNVVIDGVPAGGEDDW